MADVSTPLQQQGLVTEYLERLKTLPHSLLKNELGQLESSISAAEAAMAELGSKHNAAFVDLRTTFGELESLSRDLNDASGRALHLVKRVPGPSEKGPQSKLHAASSGTNGSTGLRNTSLTPAASLHSQVDTIQDILQIPELIQSCVSSGHYGAALDLAAFSGRLKGRYPNNRLVSRLALESDEAVSHMAQLLVRLLRESSRLPTLIKTVSFLRRTPPFKSSPTLVADLQRLFLSSRLHFLRAQVANLEVLRTTNPYLFLKKAIELFREVAFSTLTGFKSIFSVQHNEVLAQFARECASDLNTQIIEVAPLVDDDADMAGLWLQLAYCSRSLGRAGAEFWPFLDNESLSQDAWLSAYQNQLELSKMAMARAASSVNS